LPLCMRHTALPRRCSWCIG